MAYSTFLHGVRGGASVADMTIDADGLAYVIGRTGSGPFPATPSAFMPDGSEGFLAKLNVQGSALVYATHLGPGFPISLAVDRFGSAYVTGVTAGGSRQRLELSGQRTGVVHRCRQQVMASP